ncbi:hypothetical protein DRJ25_01600 [Candidatus Woesearchaeota archaeon]|nr:MAG: hypothetical protein DRJ25_01600 [Candidatus Woesearchaeota archaeon]
MKFFFIRHGETFLNRNLRINEKGIETYNGIPLSKDYNPEVFPEWFELTDVGHKQALETAYLLNDLLKNEKNIELYASKEKRAIDTSRYAAEFLNLDINLDERLNEFIAERKTETIEQAVLRFHEFIYEKVQESYKTVVAFSHKTILNSYFSKIFAGFDENIRNCEILEIEFVQNKFSLLNRFY